MIQAGSSMSGLVGSTARDRREGGTRGNIICTRSLTDCLTHLRRFYARAIICFGWILVIDADRWRIDGGSLVNLVLLVKLGQRLGDQIWPNAGPRFVAIRRCKQTIPN